MKNQININDDTDNENKINNSKIERGKNRKIIYRFDNRFF